MPPNGQRKFVDTLMRKARADYGVLLKLGVERDEYDLVFGFHAQQAIEKALKAVIAASGSEFPLTHNISALLDIIAKAGGADPPAISEPGLLTVFAVEYRYEDYDEPPPDMDRAELTVEVEHVIRWAEEVAGLHAHEGDEPDSTQR
ncbi:MAG: HEPN domain-containing protein [Candidatus Zixiibacteriota bacterium]|jgi:HEPN domain-containing protein